MEKPTNPWRVPLLLGCISLLLTATVVGVVVAAYWPKLRSLYRPASADMGDVLAVQAALQARYGTQVHALPAVLCACCGIACLVYRRGVARGLYLTLSGRSDIRSPEQLVPTAVVIGVAWLLAASLYAVGLW